MNDIELTTNSRGFYVYGSPTKDTYGGEVRVFESSSASKAHVWLVVDEEIKDNVAMSHLNVEQAQRVIAQLQAFVDQVPERWSNE